MLDVGVSPLVHRTMNRSQAPTELSEGIFDTRRYLGRDFASDDLAGFKIPQLQRE